MEPEQKITIELSGLRFHGSYGLYPVESKWNTELAVDLSINFQIPDSDTIQLKDTIDYTAIYKTVEHEMNQGHQLLESIALHLIRSVKNMDRRIQHCKVKISKHAQLGGPSKGVSVEMQY